jgi:hypothetical protein
VVFISHVRLILISFTAPAFLSGRSLSQSAGCRVVVALISFKMKIWLETVPLHMFGTELGSHDAHSKRVYS